MRPGMQKNSFLSPSAAGFSTRLHNAEFIFPGTCGKLCGICEKPLVPGGFPHSTVFAPLWNYGNIRLDFSWEELKTQSFFLSRTHKTQAVKTFFPLYLVSSTQREISFPHFVHRHLTYISPSLGPGLFFPRGKEKQWAFPPFCGILGEMARGFPACFDKILPRGRASAPDCIIIHLYFRTYSLEALHGLSFPF